MKLFITYIDNISEWSGKIVSYVALFVVFVITFEVVMRHVLHSPTNWAHETTMYLCAAIYLISGAYVHRYRGHINMDIVYTRFSPRIKAIVDLLTFPIIFLFCGMLIWFGGKFFWSSFTIGEVSLSPWGPPIYPVKLLIPLSGFLVLLQGLANIFRSCHIAIKGKEIM